MFLCGSAATLREQIERYQKEIGFGYLLPQVQFGTLPHELTQEEHRDFRARSDPAFPPRDAASPARVVAGRS